MIQLSFEPLVKEALSECKVYFDVRLAAFYLHGSIAHGDAIQGISDVDAYLVLEDCVSECDHKHLQHIANALQNKYASLVDGIHLTICGLEDLRQNDFARFALKYNATLIAGYDILQQMPVPAPERKMALGRLAFARACFQEAKAGKQPGNTGAIPSDPFYAARKFARYFVVIEGAYFLMARGTFVSFNKHEVLAGLRAAGCPYVRALNATEQILADTQAAQITHAEYLQMIEPLVNWMFDQIEKDGD